MTNTRRSVLFGLLGLLIVLGLQSISYQAFMNDPYANNGDTFMPIVNPLMNVPALVFAGIAVFYGIRARRAKERRALLGISLAVAVLIIFFFPIWPHFVSSAFDVNFKYF